MSEPNTERPIDERDVHAGTQPCLRGRLAGPDWRCSGNNCGRRSRRSSTAAGLFLALSWFGLWVSLPPLGRAIGLFVFFVLAVAATVPLFKVRWPDAIEGLRRLDRKSLMPHRPATAIADRMAPEAGDSIAVALWRAHLERALRAATALKAGTPVPQVASRDPYALRGLVLILAFAAFFVAGGDRVKRIAAAFDWHGVVSPANYRIDAWVTPPTYTGRPPLILPGLRPGEQSQARANGPVTVPAGSTLVVRATGQSGLDIAVKGGIAEAQAEAKPQAPKGTEERHFTITAAGTATVKGGSDDVVWSFNAIPDRPPTIALAKEPEPQLRGSLLLNYKTRGRLRRGRRAGDLRAQACRGGNAGLDRGQAAATAVRRAQLYAGAAAGAHPRRCRADHQGSLRASLGRRRRVDDARRPRRGQQRRPLEPARDAAAGAAVCQGSAARPDRAAPQSRARRQRQGSTC